MFKKLLCLSALYGLCLANQTLYVTYPLIEDSLPFRLSIAQANFSLPQGLQSYVLGYYKGDWVLLGGRTYGLHGFEGGSPDNFPTVSLNSAIYVVNTVTGSTISRTMTLANSGLSQEQLYQLSATNAFYFQGDGSSTLYMGGGYSINSTTGIYETKSALTAINLPALIGWVKQQSKYPTVAKCIRQTSNPILQATGGLMYQSNSHQPYLYCLGQNYTGNYFDGGRGVYTYQFRPFQVLDTGATLQVQPYTQPDPIAAYRRRDLNIVPVITKAGPSLQQNFVALGGVFTPGEDSGAWTIPIEINADGSSAMLDASNPNTFAQGMNNYTCAHAGLYSASTGDMYTLLFGGMSYLHSINGGFYSPGGSFGTDPELPFINDVTTIRIDSSGNYSQYFMSASFPVIVPDFGSDPGPEVLFGAASIFLPAEGVPYYPNGVVPLDQLNSPIVIGYIVGGIQSSAAGTVLQDDSRSSNYVFTVTLIPQ